MEYLRYMWENRINYEVEYKIGSGVGRNMIHKVNYNYMLLPQPNKPVVRVINIVEQTTKRHTSAILKYFFNSGLLEEKYVYYVIQRGFLKSNK